MLIAYSIRAEYEPCQIFPASVVEDGLQDLQALNALLAKTLVIEDSSDATKTCRGNKDLQDFVLSIRLYTE